jgi:hypothetical protein
VTFFNSSCRDFSNNNLATIEPGSFDSAIALRDLYVISAIYTEKLYTMTLLNY